jgi:hypothetical protein
MSYSTRWILAMTLPALAMLGGCAGSSSDAASAGADLSGPGGQGSTAPSSPAPAPGPAPAAQPPPADGTTITIYDGKLPSTPALAKVDDAEERQAVLGALFPTFLDDANKCDTSVTPIDLASQRGRGQVVPSIQGKVKGAFTAAGASETLYLVSVGECFASHADNFGSMMIAVFNGDKVVAKAITDGGTDIERIVDLTGDGKQELVLTTGFFQNGELTQTARIVNVAPDDLVVVKDFGGVMDDSCSADFGDKSSDFSVITVKAGTTDFVVEKKSEACPAQ